jgi:hypothetical protein
MTGADVISYAIFLVPISHIKSSFELLSQEWPLPAIHERVSLVYPNRRAGISICAMLLLVFVSPFPIILARLVWSDSVN